MKIGIAGPVSLNLLAYEGRPPDDLPSCEELIQRIVREAEERLDALIAMVQAN